jgi:hypothetical protein
VQSQQQNIIIILLLLLLLVTQRGMVIITQAQPWITISRPRLDEDVVCHRDRAFSFF